MNFNLDSIASRPEQIAIVTGANTGLGYETALELSKKAMKVILACRNERRGIDAAEKIRVQVPNADVEVMIVDVSSLSSVRKFAQAFRDHYSSLNLLVNNAGIMEAVPASKTEDGFERILAANYLGHFVLTGELLDLMPNESESRVVSLGSVAHKMGRIHFDDIHIENQYSAAKAYAQSKLACIMFADELQRRLAANGRNILSVSAHPGGSLTDLNRNMSTIGQMFSKWILGPVITHSVQAGTLPTLVAALSPEMKGGEYIGPTRRFEFTGPPGYAKRAKQALDCEAGNKLFDLSERLTKTHFGF